MRTPLEPDRKGKAWLDVTSIEGGEVVSTVDTEAYKADRVTAGMLINMSPNYYVDVRYEFPKKGEKGKDGKRVE